MLLNPNPICKNNQTRRELNKQLLRVLIKDFNGGKKLYLLNRS